MKSTSKKRTPNTVNLTVKRRYLTEREVERLMDCARKHGRYGHRNATMILVAYRHGLRASEVCDLQWQQIELSEGRLHVHRVKNGIPSVHPIRGDEMRALRKLRRDYPTDAHVFVSERGGPIKPYRFPPAYPAPRRGRQDAIPDPPAHASPCLRVQTRERWPRHAGPATLPRAQEHSAHGQVHRNGARPIQGLLEGLTLGLGHLGAAASGRRQARDDFRFPFDHLSIRRIAFRDHRLNELNGPLNLLIGHRLDAAGMLRLHLPRHQHGADLEIAGRTFPAHPLEHLSPMLLPILR